jgi:uncharacterized protein YggE
MPKDTTTMSSNETLSLQPHPTFARPEGITVIGEAVRRVPPESAEFVIEIGATAPTAAQALRDIRSRTDQLGQALSPLGVQQVDVQTISFNVYSLYSPATPPLLGYGAIPQIQAGLSPMPTGGPLTPDVQFGSYLARTTLRIVVRDVGRVGEIVDTATRAGGILTGGFTFRVADETQARRAALEAAGRDARAKAETLAASTGKQIGDAVAISEDIVASNGTYLALRAAFPLAFGAGAPQSTGQLEYYARVSAAFRLQ